MEKGRDDVPKRRSSGKLASEVLPPLGLLVGVGLVGRRSVLRGVSLGTLGSAFFEPSNFREGLGGLTVMSVSA